MATINGNFTVVVNPAPSGLAMNPQGGNLPAESVGVAVSDDVCVVSGGTAPYSFQITGGQLPPGLSLVSTQNPDMSETISIEGTPTQSGAFSFTLTVSDSAGANTSVKVGG
jgi:hypothetical protein